MSGAGVPGGAGANDCARRIEFGIVATYRDCPCLSDYDILRTKEGSPRRRARTEAMGGCDP